MPAILFIVLPLLLGVAVFILFCLATLITWFINFSFRSKLTYPCDYNYDVILKKIGINHGMPQLIGIWLGFSVAFVITTVILFISFGVSSAYRVGFEWIWLLLVPTIPLMTRFIVDVCRSLKINHKTGDSERIAKLEQELESLKSRSKPLL